MIPRLSRRWLLMVLTTGLLILSTIFLHHLHPPPASHTLKNGAYKYAPDWSHYLIEDILGHPPPDFPPPTIFDELILAPPLDLWVTPNLTTSKLLCLHVFSTSSEHSRKRREFIRSHSPLHVLPPEYRSLVEMKFILGRPNPDHMNELEVILEEKEIQEEMEKYGDIVRLEGLVGGDNMNNGKSWEWAKWVGGQSEEAQWVMKCDDDTFPILPNLIDLLVSLDPATPTYFGTALGHWIGYHYYFEGMMYGFTWSVVKTLAVANVPDEHVQWQMDEDARMGEVMYSLPSRSKCNQQYSEEVCDPRTPPSGGWAVNPPSPDLRTGLVRYDVGHRLGYKHHWWIADTGSAIGWHGLKDDQDYMWAYERAMKYFMWKGKSLWLPPLEIRSSS